jgi:hypothetical protein
MALSMEERRILAQIEVHLSQDDPRLAQRFSKFGSPGPPGRPRPRRRARVIAAVAVAVIGVATAIATAVITALS